MTTVEAWFDTDAEPGAYAVTPGRGAGSLRLGSPAESPPAEHHRRISAWIEVGIALDPSSDSLPEGCPFVVLRLNDPEVEAYVMGLEEADSAGLDRTAFVFMPVLVGPEGMHHAAFADADRARAFLSDEVETAERHGAEGMWSDLLDAAPVDGEGCPTLWLDDEFLSTLDGLHRLAGHVANDSPGAFAFLALPKDRDLSECVGVVLAVPGADYPIEASPIPSPGM